ncbi:hypothetical protein B0T21DRAFT_398594 [Apiosordaria backusii]|uniref:Leucine rich repeat domain containing protein n=1 Tax=Apiosordaria backusii TaxID=314023 RepID=A0AA40EZQ5_9PEZI|nr:hypothetical protein B0T21DRAFT_398594 [Apiosordaria backusii]
MDETTPNPPSYQEATRRLDWVELIAPYVPIREYARLCLVDRRFYRHLAPRLWNDPLAAASAGKPATRLLVTCLDLRGLEAGTAELSLYSLNRSLSAYLRAVRITFPQLRCVLLTGHLDVEADDLAVATVPDGVGNDSSREGLLMLSIPRCQVKLPTAFFSSPYLSRLVYLDVSNMAGSLRKPLVQRTLGPDKYPDLRILKVQGREMGDSTAALLLRIFKQQLWSLDLSQNELTDAVLHDLHNFAFPADSLRTESHFDVEGRLETIPNQGTSRFGQFGFIRESQWSADFDHPERYLIDAPVYTRLVEDAPQEGARTRLNGRKKIRDDSEDGIRTLLSGAVVTHPPKRECLQDLDVFQNHNGLTHLYLNDNSITSSGLVRLIMSSPGQLEHLECDSMVYDMHEAAKPEWLSASVRVSGLLGAAHIFRPVLSSNLQVLRIHHSLVTQLLSLNLRGEVHSGGELSTMANLWLAETFLLPRAEMAYPQAFAPDMNPRLRLLALTHLPRWSTGPLIDRLINLLKLASMQERAIQDMNRILNRNHRGPVAVSGLRHIRLEFDNDSREELLLEDSEEDEEEKKRKKNAEEFAAKGFSFFDESRFSDFSFGSSPAASPVANTEVSSSNINTAMATNTDTTPLTSVAAAATDDHRSFLDENRNQSVSNQSQNKRPCPSHPPRTGDTSELILNGGNEDESARLIPAQQQQQQQQYTELPSCTTTTVVNSSTGNWNGAEYTVPIWIGPPPPPAIISTDEDTPQRQRHQQQEVSPAVLVYMQNILDKHLCADAQPASPCHVLAGVPEGEFVWGAAWQAIVTGGDSAKTKMGKPKKRELLNEMRDVIEGIKAYRRETRARFEVALKMARQKGEEVRLGEPHFHYGGRLEVVRAEREGEGMGWR